MVEINNQRKAFLDMLAWSEGIDNGRQKTRNHGYDASLYAESYLLDVRSPSQTLSPLNPKLKSTGAGRYQLLSRYGMPTASSAWPERLSPKVRTLWHCSRLRSVVLTYDWSWWYPSGNRPLQHIRLYCRALLRLPEHKADSLIAKFKEAAERSERLMREQSHRDYLRSGYLHHRLPVMGC